MTARVPHAGLAEKPVLSLKFTAAVTAIAFAARSTNAEDGAKSQQTDILAVGLENGEVQIMSVAILSTADVECSGTEPASVAAEAHSFTPASPALGRWEQQMLWQAPAYSRHTGAVRRLRWRTVGPDQYQLASCSDDHAVRTYTVRLSIKRAASRPDRGIDLR